MIKHWLFVLLFVAFGSVRSVHAQESWQAEWEVWHQRPLEGLELVYLWVDGVYIKAGLEKTKAGKMIEMARR